MKNDRNNDSGPFSECQWTNGVLFCVVPLYRLARFQRTAGLAHRRIATRHFSTTIAMSFPTPLITGTIAYLVIAAVLIGGVLAGLASGQVSKDNAGSVFVFGDDCSSV